MCRKSGSALTVLACALLPAAVALAEVDTDVTLRLGAGHDSNPLRVSGDGSGAGYFTLEADTGLEASLGGSRLFARASAERRQYGSDRSLADHERGELRLGLVLPQVRPAGKRLDTAFGGFHAVRRGTFTNRATGLVYVTPSLADPEQVVPIPDRLDSDVTGLFANARWRLARRLMVSMESEWASTAYGEDYAATTALDSLESSSLSLEPGVRYLVGDAVLLGASVVLTSVDYDSRPALDAGGEEVPDATRRYDYVRYRVAVQVAPGSQWRVRGGFDSTQRSDAYAGFNDYGSTGVWASLEQRLGQRVRLTIYGASQSLDYDSATVTGSPDGEIRANDERRLLGRVAWRLNPRWSWYAETGLQRVDSTDAEYAYDRDWAMAGIEFSY